MFKDVKHNWKFPLKKENVTIFINWIVETWVYPTDGVSPFRRIAHWLVLLQNL